jgi:hypothetical protein
MIGLGLEEPLPSQEVIDELYELMIPRAFSRMDEMLMDYIILGTKYISRKSTHLSRLSIARDTMPP